jgi:hypothetical protein
VVGHQRAQPLSHQRLVINDQGLNHLRSSLRGIRIVAQKPPRGDVSMLNQARSP